MIERQCAARELQYSKRPIISIDEALKQNYEKGMVAGMRLALATPATLVEILREQFNEKLVEERTNVSQ